MLLLLILWRNHNERGITCCPIWYWSTGIDWLNLLGNGDRSSLRIHIQTICIAVSKIIWFSPLNFRFYSADIARTTIDIKYPWIGVRLTDVEFDPNAGHSKADLFTVLVLTTPTIPKTESGFRNSKTKINERSVVFREIFEYEAENKDLKHPWQPTYLPEDNRAFIYLSF